MIPNRSRLRAVLFLVLAISMASFPVLAPALAQTSTEQSLTDSIGKIFRDVIGGPEEKATAQSETAPVSEPRREPPRSQADMMQSFSPLVKATAPAVVNVYANAPSSAACLPLPVIRFSSSFSARECQTEPRSSLRSGPA